VDAEMTETPTSEVAAAVPTSPLHAVKRAAARRRARALSWGRIQGRCASFSRSVKGQNEMRNSRKCSPTNDYCCPRERPVPHIVSTSSALAGVFSQAEGDSCPRGENDRVDEPGDRSSLSVQQKGALALERKLAKRPGLTCVRPSHPQLAKFRTIQPFWSGRRARLRQRGHGGGRVMHPRNRCAPTIRRVSRAAAMDVLPSSTQSKAASAASATGMPEGWERTDSIMTRVRPPETRVGPPPIISRIRPAVRV